MEQAVVILGAGINGAALARELLLNHIPVVLVDAADVASGATSASSRLIHGGLRYLEYADLALVRESLAERKRLLHLAPHLVRPLEIFIPVQNRFGGIGASARRMLGRSDEHTGNRGLWLVRSGLKLYDTIARDTNLPGHRSYRTSDPGCLPLNARQFPWQCSYFDAQVAFPERLVLALLDDAREIAQQAGLRFAVHTYRRARLHGRTVEIVAPSEDTALATVEPAALVNATGAWVDWTLRDLRVVSKRLIGGTKGSHLITFQPAIRELLAGRGVYAEAADGRPFFVLPLRAGTLIGTTDLPYEDDPREAVATPVEIEYLIESVAHILPQAGLTADEIDWHYSGVRPLPSTEGRPPGAVSRRHSLHEHPEAPLPCFSVVGGKLTTCRSLAEEFTGEILKRLEKPVIGNSEQRPLPGGENYPLEAESLAEHSQRLASRFSVPPASVESLWTLCGSRCEAILDQLSAGSGGALSAGFLDGTSLPIDFARWTIEHHWATTLDDLIHRRLMLLYGPRLTTTCLNQLAQLLVEAGHLGETDAASNVAAAIDRLYLRHGKRVEPADGKS